MNVVEERLVEETESTMDLAKRCIDEGDITEGKPIAFRTTVQTKGRGTHGRTWTGLSGNVMTTLALPQRFVPAQRLGLLPLEVAVAVFEAVADFVPREQLTLKWPNDLLDRDGKKISGTIIESHNGWFLVGVGINVVMAPALLGDQTAQRAAGSMTEILHRTAGEQQQQQRAKDCSAAAVSAAFCCRLVSQLTGPSRDLVAEWSMRTDWSKNVFRRDLSNVALRPVRLNPDGSLHVALPDDSEEDLYTEYLI